MPTPLASDSFDRANANPIGAPWSTSSGNVAMQIVSNVATPTDPTTNDDTSYYSGITWPGDHYSKAKLTVNSTAGGGAGVALIVRQDPAANTRYRLVVDHAASNNVVITKFLAGTPTNLTGWPVTQAWTDGDTWELRVTGSVLQVFLTPASTGIRAQVGASTTDAGVPSGGSPGIGVSTSVTSASINDWEGGSVLSPFVAPATYRAPRVGPYDAKGFLLSPFKQYNYAESIAAAGASVDSTVTVSAEASADSVTAEAISTAVTASDESKAASTLAEAITSSVTSSDETKAASTATEAFSVAVTASDETKAASTATESYPVTVASVDETKAASVAAEAIASSVGASDETFAAAVGQQLANVDAVVAGSSEAQAALSLAEALSIAIQASSETDANSVLGGAQSQTGQPVVPNTVARLSNLFVKTYYNGPLVNQPSLAVTRFLDELKVERKKVLTDERRKLASLKAEKRSVEEKAVAKKPVEPEKVRELDIKLGAQSQVVRDARKLYEEADKTRSEQSRIDQLAEYALEQWNVEEGKRRIAAEEEARVQRGIQEAEDEEMAHVLLMVHEL